MYLCGANDIICFAYKCLNINKKDNMKKLLLVVAMAVVSLSAHCQIVELQKKANKGDAEAQYKLGHLYYFATKAYIIMAKI